MMVLVSDLALGLDALRPVDHQRIVLAAPVFALLEVAEGRVAGHGPTRMVVRIARCVPPAVVIPQVGIKGRLHAVQHIGFVKRAG